MEHVCLLTFNISLFACAYFCCDAERSRKHHLILFRQTFSPSSVCLLAPAAEESAALMPTLKDGIIWLFKREPTDCTGYFI